MGGVGAAIGSVIGGAFGKKLGDRSGGAAIGKAIGGALPGYKKGGKVKKTGLALVHKNEFVLPRTVKPTKAQKAKVAKLNKK